MQLKYDLFFWHKELTEEQILAYFGYGSADDSGDSQDLQDFIDTQILDGELASELEINPDSDVEFSKYSGKQSSEQPSCSIDSKPTQQRRRRRRMSRPKV
ncbi:hypothetical protein HCG51_04270 [Tolypothrix sp. PCC 7910]|uniref:hypothetical protein n=1 Tax=Tolypothrix sp. PCC 7910 TaxID=2099387 RepID=UPI00142773AF|nr:hypothetical protein [Tolypothrix sp. PCC 7910]QIR36054.1 hypothetical protein HCG51_04270 [Tolypothrix sp. PCC 7910]